LCTDLDRCSTPEDHQDLATDLVGVASVASVPNGDRHTGDLDSAAGQVPKIDDDLLTMAEVAAIVRAPVATLRYWRHLGTGPRSFRVGRGVRYWRTDVNLWLEQQKQNDNATVDGSTPRR
jgi:predicted DNA-binding transcriptional regulator AlpA